GSTGPVIEELAPRYDKGKEKAPVLVAIGNRFTVAEPFRFYSPKVFLHGNTSGDLMATTVELPTAPPPRVQRQVFEVTDAKDLQAAVDQVAAIAKADPQSQPVVHLAANPGKSGLLKTVEIPGGLRFSIEGDGGLSRLAPPGDAKTGKDPALRLAGPSRIELSDLFFLNFHDRDGAPMIEVRDADQPGGRIWGDNVEIPIAVQGLGQTVVWLTDYMFGWVHVSGASKPGSGFTAVMGGAGSGDLTMMAVRDGARVFACDVWSEQGNKPKKPWALASGAGAQPGEMVLEAMYLFQDTGPEMPFIVAEDFDGRVTILGVSNTGAGAVRGNGAKTIWLDLRGESALVEGQPGKLGRFDAEGADAPINPQWLDEQLAFARKMRWGPVRAPTAEGTTDLRLHRLKNLIPHHGPLLIGAEPQRGGRQ
ncbi:MAG: hypothetical protein N3A66_05700, partial [Planctomycetota bacterium]|nr:hypothetical protein [Planctomycetota bacterium]